MSELDIRWQQRLTNYSKALEQLGNAISTNQQRPLSELEKQGLIQAFEFTHGNLRARLTLILLSGKPGVRYRLALQYQ